MEFCNPNVSRRNMSRQLLFRTEAWIYNEILKAWKMQQNCVNRRLIVNSRVLQRPQIKAKSREPAYSQVLNQNKIILTFVAEWAGLFGDGTRRYGVPAPVFPK